jgi:hypothetical protein
MNTQYFLEPTVGLPVDHLVCFLAHGLQNATHLNFFVPRPVMPIQTRLRGSNQALHIVDSALRLRSETGLPFWDAANLKCFDQGAQALPVLKEALFHNGPAESLLKVPTTSVTLEWLHAIAATEAQNSILVLSSRVQVVDRVDMHIPMLDFHCPESGSSLDLVNAALQALGINSGFIVRSGKSFHYYGRELIGQVQWTRFLSRALLLAPIVDRCWIAHQLIEGSGGLRISTRIDAARPPEIVAVL